MSSLFSQASLVVEPAVYEDGLVYATKPFDGSGDLTFTRGSDIEATRVNANGYIEKAKVNVLLQSNSFDNASWTKSNASVTANTAVAPDGTTTADTFAVTANFGTISQAPTYSSGQVSTYSVYVKNIDAAVFNLQVRTSSTAGLATFNFSGSTLTSSTLTTGITQGFTDVGNGWYRCFVTFVTTETNQLCRLQIQDSGDSVYVWAAQLNYGLVAQEYQETTTTSVVTGITNDMPRLDYSGGASCPSALLEPSRQNLVTQSEFFGAWSNTEDTTVSSNNALSPEGVINASKLIPQATSNFHRISQSFTVTASTPYTFSVFVKKAGYDYFLIRTGDGTNNNVGFDLANGTVTFEASGYSGFIESFGNDWYRVGYVRSFAISAVTIFLRANPTLVDFTSIPAFTGDGTSGALVYGAQLEQGSYSTSLIPTYGTSATRTSDACSKTGISSLIGQTEGTLFIDIDFQNMGTGVVQVIASIDDSANNKRIEIWANGNIINGFIGATTGGNITIGSTTLTDGHHKLVLAYKQSGDHAFYIDGTQIGTSSTAYTIPSLNNFKLFYWNNSLYPQVEYHQALLFKTRLSNSDLAALTS